MKFEPKPTFQARGHETIWISSTITQKSQNLPNIRSLSIFTWFHNHIPPARIARLNLVRSERIDPNHMISPCDTGIYHTARDWLDSALNHCITIYYHTFQNSWNIFYVPLYFFKKFRIKIIQFVFEKYLFTLRYFKGKTF